LKKWPRKQIKELISISNIAEKNIVKILNVPVKINETEDVLITSVQNILKKLEITLDKEQILAIHRIQGKTGDIKPVLMKLKK
jgi:hypothetical protein